MNTIRVDIVSASELLYSGSAKRVFIPAKMGEIGVLPRHTPFLSTLRPGDVRIEYENDEVEHIYVSGGIVEVQPDVVTVLSDTAIRAGDLDEQRALEAKKRAEEALQNVSSEQELATTKAALFEAIAQLGMLDDLRRKK